MEETSPKNYKEYIEEIDPQRYWLVLKRRFFPAASVFALCVGLAILRAFLQQPAYEAQGKLIFQQRNPTSELTGIGQQMGELDVQSGAANPLGTYLKTQTVVLSSLPLLQATIQGLQLKNDDGELMKPDEFAETITIEPVLDTNILQISSQSPDPELAAAVVNKLMGLYLQMNISSNRETASKANQFVGKELPQAEKSLNRAAEDLRQFKNRYQIASLNSEVAALIGQIATLDGQINQAKAQLVSATAQFAATQRQLKLTTGDSIDRSALSEAPGVQQSLADLQKLQTEIASLRQTYTSDHPYLSELEGKEASYRTILNQRIQEVVGSSTSVKNDSLQMDSIKKQLAANLANAETLRLSSLQQLQELQRIRSSYSQKLGRMPNLEKMQLLLEQRLAAAKVNYDTLLTKRKEIELAENQSLANVHILEKAIVPEKAMSGRLKVLALGVIAGTLLSIGVAFLLDLIDKSIKTVKDAEALLKYPFLGLIPKYRTDEQAYLSESESFSPGIVVLAEHPSSASASYQMLEANLRFLSSDRKARAIVITSAVSGEGKTSVAANLAATLAQSGKSVLLVDADMRSPSQHLLWNLSNLYGLSHVLVGENTLNKTLKKVAPNLSVLPAGVMPPTPQALLDSDKMHSLMQMFLQNYSYVIFDTPPLTSYPDAAILGKIAEGVLFVLRPRIVTSVEAIAAKTLLSRSNVRVLGLVANAVAQGYEHEEYLPSYFPTKTYPESASRQRNSPHVNTTY